MTLLVLTALLCLLLSPELGITDNIRHATFGPAVDGLSETPQKTLAWGMVCLFLMALAAFFAGWRLPDWTGEEAEKGWKVLSR